METEEHKTQKSHLIRYILLSAPSTTLKTVEREPEDNID